MKKVFIGKEIIIELNEEYKRVKITRIIGTKHVSIMIKGFKKRIVIPVELII